MTVDQFDLERHRIWTELLFIVVKNRTEEGRCWTSGEVCSAADSLLMEWEERYPEASHPRKTAEKEEAYKKWSEDRTAFSKKVSREILAQTKEKTGTKDWVQGKYLQEMKLWDESNPKPL